jgi:hypothetical protein
MRETGSLNLGTLRNEFPHGATVRGDSVYSWILRHASSV